MSDNTEEPPVRAPIEHFFSPSTGGFYASDIHTPDQIPSDALAVPLDLYVSIFEGRGTGRPMIVGEDGMPALGDLPVPSPELIAANMRLDRSRRLADCDWTQVLDSPLSPQAKTAWAAYRQALRDYPAQPPGTDWPEAPGGS
jgi:hypothetical protein